LAFKARSREHRDRCFSSFAASAAKRSRESQGHAYCTTRRDDRARCKTSLADGVAVAPRQPTQLIPSDRLPLRGETSARGLRCASRKDAR
jgi:hypothetical protein